MTIYLVNMAMVFFFSWCADHFKYRSRPGRDGKQLPLMVFVVLVIISLQMLGGFRYNVGTDYITYAILYDDVIFRGTEYFFPDKLEIGFLAICKLLGYVTAKPFLMFFVKSLIITILLILALRENSTCFWFSCMLLIFTLSYYGTFNAVRQAVAIGFMLYSSKYLFKGEFWKYCFVIILGALFHRTAVTMIPVYFVVRRPAWSKLMLGFIIGVIAAYLLYNLMLAGVLGVLGGTKYGNEEYLSADMGANVLQFLVQTAPLLPAFLFRKELRQRFPQADIVVNLCTISCGIMLIAMRHVYFARLGMYFSIYITLLAPMLWQVFHDKKVKIAVGGLMLACYFIFCLVLMPVSSDLLPYQSIFSLPSDWTIIDEVSTR